ncbi:HAD family hydrolase [Streptomyces millisiae]|uniref:Haloacid dehalogenase-like hydrolase n=1 Tax=Streptomyces millisiae TaxID=3075542 RepID=A0ABU2LPA3_9ACTN|nr:haloacid dehalogenase-like hydrolase [Streptomyces sp. DSM 44918]MDT0319411.1 haloacid dehalogenase-like hydrolase [Streptomyces sp. DSM 44918]
MTVADAVLVLWDIDRTLLYVGDTDRQVYRETFHQVIGHSPEKLPQRGTGVTMPLAIRTLLLDNGVHERDIPQLLPRMVELLPERLATHVEEMKRSGRLLPGAVEALHAVHEAPTLIPTVVTGNLKPNAEIKLRTFHLAPYLDLDIGGFASDDQHRPALVGVAQKRAQEKHGLTFTQSNTVIVGDSLEDVRTGLEGGALVIGVASGTTSGPELRHAGANLILPDLRNPEVLLAAIATLAQ